MNMDLKMIQEWIPVIGFILTIVIYPLTTLLFILQQLKSEKYTDRKVKEIEDKFTDSTGKLLTKIELLESSHGDGKEDIAKIERDISELKNLFIGVKEYMAEIRGSVNQIINGLPRRKSD